MTSREVNLCWLGHRGQPGLPHFSSSSMAFLGHKGKLPCWCRMRVECWCSLRCVLAHGKIRSYYGWALPLTVNLRKLSGDGEFELSQKAWRGPSLPVEVRGMSLWVREGACGSGPKAWQSACWYESSFIDEMSGSILNHFGKLTIILIWHLDLSYSQEL